MIIKALKSTIEYVLKEDSKLDVEDQTTFIFRQPNLKEQLDQRGTGDIEVFGDPSKSKEGDTSSAVSSVKTVIKSDQILLKKTNLVRSCLIEIQNLKDDNGDAIEWNKKMNNLEKDKILANLLPYITELSDCLISDMGLTGDEEGN